MKFVDLGVVDYKSALDEQLNQVARAYEDSAQSTVLFCEHPPVVTLGRSSQPNDVCGWDGDVVEISRGGRATYHGPGQVVIYPILNLANPVVNIAPRDVHAYLRFLETTIVDALRILDVQAEVKETIMYDSLGKKLSFTGVWVGDKKVASIGIAVKRWVAYHGIAINIDKDPLAFTGINPCGFGTDVMTSLEECGVSLSKEQFKQAYEQAVRAYA